MVEGHKQALEDVGARPRLGEVKLRPTGHDVHLVVDVVTQYLGQGQQPGHAVHERKVDDAKRRLQHRVLVEVVEDDLGNGSLLEVHNQAQALTVGLVAHVGDALDTLVVHELGYLLLEVALVDPIGKLGEDELVTPAL